MAQLAEARTAPRLLDMLAVGNAAADLRRKAGLDRPPYSGRTMILAAMPHVVVTGDDLPNGLHEMVVLDEGKELIVYSKRINAAAQRVAIAHGLGHLLFDAGRTSQPSGGCGRTYEHHDAPAIERRADLFAAELLVPMRDLDERFPGELFPKGAARRPWDDYVDHVASSGFNVPSGFLKWRLFDLAKLRASHWAI